MKMIAVSRRTLLKPELLVPKFGNWWRLPAIPENDKGK